MPVHNARVSHARAACAERDGLTRTSPMPQRSDSLVDYYSRGAAEYESIFERDDPVRQDEQAALTSAMQAALRGRRVLELACGTGYWTERLAVVAEEVLATDASEEMLGLARSKPLDRHRVRFQLADAYKASAMEGDFNGGLANFWLSHVARSRLRQFLAQFHQRLESGSVIFIADNMFVPGLGGELVAVPGAEDTFKNRTLSDGSRCDILKNYFDADELQAIFTPWGRNLRIHRGECFWWATYELE